VISVIASPAAIALPLLFLGLALAATLPRAQFRRLVRPSLRGARTHARVPRRASS
jgi:hypothetical protein